MFESGRVPHEMVAVVRRGERRFALDRCAAPCPHRIPDVDLLESLDRTLLDSVAFLLVDDAESLSTIEAKGLVDTYAPIALVGVMSAADDRQVDRLTSAGMVLAFTVEELSPAFLHRLAVSFGQTAANLEDLASAAAYEAVLRDRKRTARDLHDQVIQQLFALGMDIERLLVPDPQLRDHARALGRRLDDAIDDLRAAVGSLRSGTTPLPSQRLKRVADDAGELSGRELDYTITGDADRLPKDIQATLVTVLREALANAIKHGEGPITVRLEIDGELKLSVRTTAASKPDGHGRTESTPPIRRGSSGHGLSNLNTRAVLLGGSSELTTLVDGSTLFRWSVPIPEDKTRTATAAPAA